MKDCWFFYNNFNGLSDESLDDVMDMEFLDLPLTLGMWKLMLWRNKIGMLSSTNSLKTHHHHLDHFHYNPLSSVDKLNMRMQNSARVFVLLLDLHMAKLFLSRMIKGKDLLQFQTNSSISVFESSSSSPSVDNSNFELPVIPTKRPQNKHQRLSNISLLYSIPFILTLLAFQKCQRMVFSESDLQTQPAGELLCMVTKKQGKKDIPMLANKIEMKRSSSQESVALRKCLHCEVTKTPQWREGPMGPKTLCNVCGVRYQSGRLFAEYQPAASPTFVSSLHSNSHKKVLEMRDRATRVTVR